MNREKQDTKVLIINGSPRSFGRSRSITRYAEEALRAQGFQVRLIELAEFELPLYNGAAEQEEDPRIQEWKAAAKEADSFFISTPEYHAGPSGALKNALDYLGSEHFRGKPVAIAAMSGGGKGGMNALNQLRIILRSLYAWVIPGQIIVNKDQVDAPNKQIVDPEAQRRLDLVIEELSEFTRKLV